MRAPGGGAILGPIDAAEQVLFLLRRKERVTQTRSSDPEDHAGTMNTSTKELRRSRCGRSWLVEIFRGILSISGL